MTAAGEFAATALVRAARGDPRAGVLRRQARRDAGQADRRSRRCAPIPVASPTNSARRGTMVRGRAAWLTADHALAHQLLRSDDFSVTAIGKTLPGPAGLARAERTTSRAGCIRCCRRRCCPSNRPSTPATARRCRRCSPPEPLRRCGNGCSRRRPTCSTASTTAPSGQRRRRRRLLLAAAGHRHRRHPRRARPRPAPHPRVRRARRPQPRHRAVVGRSTCASSSGLDGFNTWLARPPRHLQRNPGDDLMSQLIEASDDGTRLDDEELRATAGLVLAAGFETTVNLLGNGIRILLEHPDQLAMLLRRPRTVARRGRGDPAAGVAGAAERAHRPRRHRGRGTHRRGRRARHPLPRRRQPRSRGVRRPAPLRHHPRQRGQAPVVLRWQALLPRCRAGPRRGRGRAARRSSSAIPDARLAGAGSRRDTRVLRGWSTLPIRLGEARAAVRS